MMFHFRLCLSFCNKKAIKGDIEIKIGHDTVQDSSALMSVTRVFISEGCLCMGSYF